MIKSWTDGAWEDYLYWQSADKRILKRINVLIVDIERNGNNGIGKPESLKNNLQGYWSRRINSEHRLIYALKEAQIIIVACRYHYS